MIPAQFYLMVFSMLCALITAYLLTPFAMRLGVKAGLLDLPGGRRHHKSPTPRSGGLVIFAGFFLSLFLAIQSELIPPANHTFHAWFTQVLTASAIVLAVGLLDDRLEVRPSLKLLGQLVAASLAWFIGIRLESLTGIPLPPALDLAATLFLFVTGMNAYNLIDGMDGVASGLGAITGLGLAGLNLLLGNFGMAAASMAVCGACLGFLRYNFHPARIFLGDSGSMLIGFLLIAVTLGSSARGAAAIMLIIPLLTLGVPMIDTGLAIWRRSVRKATGEGNGVSHADRDHLHHRLARKGLTQRRVAITLYFTQAVVFAIGLLWVFGQNHRVAIFTVTFFAGTYVILRYMATVEMTDSGQLIIDGIRRPGRRRLLSAFMPCFDTAILSSGVFLLYHLLHPDMIQGHIIRFLRETAPTVISGPVILLWATRYYRPMWSRARVLDYFYLTLLSLGGLCIGISLSTIPLHSSLRETATITLLLSALTLPPMIGLRIFPRLVQDMMNFHDRRATPKADSSLPRVLVYGAGYGFTLLTRAESFDDSPRKRKYQLIGLLDDDDLLRGSHIHGHRVLGTLHDLPRLITDEHIDEVIVTTKLTPENMRTLLHLAAEYNLLVRQSLFTHRILHPPHDPLSPPEQQPPSTKKMKPTSHLL